MRAVVGGLVLSAIGLFVGAVLHYGTTAALLAVPSAGLMLAVLWGRPRLALVTWVWSLVLIPVWIGLDVPTVVDAHCIVAVIASCAVVSQIKLRITRYDAYMAGVTVVALIAVLFADSPVDLWRQILVRWVAPYLAARILVSATGTRFATNVLAIALGSAGFLAVIELVMVWHPYVNWDNGTPDFTAWHTIQVRNGRDRSEGAFGHSIALGAALALAIPFIARGSFRWPVKTVLLVGVSLGIYTTQSRGALAAAALTGGICLVYLARSRVSRTLVVTGAGLSALAVSSYLEPLWRSWARGESNEAQTSFDYRGQLYSTYLKGIEWIGKSPMYLTGSSGGLRSTDSAFLAVGLRFGWVVLAAVIIPLMISAIRVLLGRAGAAEIAIVGQLPVFATVALITQYESLLFMTVGTAVQMALERSGNSDLDAQTAPAQVNAYNNAPSATLPRNGIGPVATKV